MKVLKSEERHTETVFTLVIEHEGKEYTWQAVSGDHNSFTEWYDENWRLIDQPDWADDLDMWEIYNEDWRNN